MKIITPLVATMLLVACGGSGSSSSGSMNNNGSNVVFTNPDTPKEFVVAFNADLAVPDAVADTTEPEAIDTLAMASDTENSEPTAF